MNGFGGGVESHGPAPEQCTAFKSRAAIDDLLDLAFAAVAADRENRRTMHRKQQGRTIEEGDREHVERVVEQVAMRDGEIVGPVKMWEDAEWHRLAPASHQQWTDEAEHEIQP